MPVGIGTQTRSAKIVGRGSADASAFRRRDLSAFEFPQLFPYQCRCAEYGRIGPVDTRGEQFDHSLVVAEHVGLHVPFGRFPQQVARFGQPSEKKYRFGEGKGYEIGQRLAEYPACLLEGGPCEFVAVQGGFRLSFWSLSSPQERSGACLVAYRPRVSPAWYARCRWRRHRSRGIPGVHSRTVSRRA